MNLSQARKEIKALGLRITRTDFDEYRVAEFPDREASAYYTPDLDDALDTARAMAAHLKAKAARAPRLTILNVNKAIVALGIKAELVKGEGYFYFIGDDVDACLSTSVYVYRLTDIPTIIGWIDELRTILAGKDES
jgi:hypothetical protein